MAKYFFLSIYVMADDLPPLTTPSPAANKRDTPLSSLLLFLLAALKGGGVLYKQH
jgi:hypothetical protein